MKKGTYEDQIRIEELEVYAHHGVYPEENEKGQHFYVNATLYTNTRPAGVSVERMSCLQVFRYMIFVQERILQETAFSHISFFPVKCSFTLLSVQQAQICLLQICKADRCL